MDSVAILYHPHKPEASNLAEEVKQWLAAREIDAWAAPAHDGPLVSEALAERVGAASLLVVLGGDGSTLRAARLAAPWGVPIFGINMGRVGFLSEAEPENWRSRLSQVMAGDCWIERRLMLHATLWREEKTVATFVALNDVVVGRGAQARVLRLRLYVDGDHVTTYMADGLIVATPTGSTAYAMAAGGPLLPPQLLNFLVVPVAPHLSLDRAVILHEEAKVAIEVEMDHEATVAADGQNTVSLRSGDRVVVGRHKDMTCFARVSNSSYFYHRLMERLGFWHPRKQD
jgi:NAD+ kinase